MLRGIKKRLQSRLQSIIESVPLDEYGNRNGYIVTVEGESRYDILKQCNSVYLEFDEANQAAQLAMRWHDSNRCSYEAVNIYSVDIKELIPIFSYTPQIPYGYSPYDLPVLREEFEEEFGYVGSDYDVITWDSFRVRSRDEWLALNWARPYIEAHGRLGTNKEVIEFAKNELSKDPYYVYGQKDCYGC